MQSNEQVCFLYQKSRLFSRLRTGTDSLQLQYYSGANLSIARCSTADVVQRAKLRIAKDSSVLYDSFFNEFLFFIYHKIYLWCSCFTTILKGMPAVALRFLLIHWIYQQRDLVSLLPRITLFQSNNEMC